MRRMNPDGTPWYPSTGGRICSVYFVEGKNDIPTHPAYIPTLFMSSKPNCSKSGDADLDYSMDESMRRFARRQDRKRLQESRAQLEESDENKLDTFRKNFAEEHNYAALASIERMWVMSTILYIMELRRSVFFGAYRIL